MTRRELFQPRPTFRPSGDPPPLPEHERRVLFQALGIAVVDFRCRARGAGYGRDEPNPTHSIALVRRGVFVRARRGQVVLADPNSVLFFNAAEPYRYAHPIPGGDRCTILTIETPRALELVARRSPRDAENPAAPFRWGDALAGSGVARLHYELLQRLRQRDGLLALEDTVSELADETIDAACGDDAVRAGGRALAGRTLRHNLEMVEAVKLAINERVDSPPGLGRLATLVGCSPFHLSRTFRQTVGVSLRTYTRRLRVRLAAERLAAGEPDLTTLGLDLGFADHSHFTNTFRREWGVPPSRFRAGRGRA